MVWDMAKMLEELLGHYGYYDTAAVMTQGEGFGGRTSRHWGRASQYILTIIPVAISFKLI